MENKEARNELRASLVLLGFQTTNIVSYNESLEWHIPKYNITVRELATCVGINQDCNHTVKHVKHALPYIVELINQEENE